MARRTKADIDDAFEMFWAVFPKRYPHPNPKSSARMAFDSALKRGVKLEDLLAGTEGYARYCSKFVSDPKFICMAQTFLRQNRYAQFMQQGVTTKDKWSLLLGN